MHNVPLQVVKVADFGVARVKAGSGIMTAETGTYRWMAPEVCGTARSRGSRAQTHEVHPSPFFSPLPLLSSQSSPFIELQSCLRIAVVVWDY